MKNVKAMVDNIRSSLDEHDKAMLDLHLNVGAEKPISYLPINTIEKVIGIPVSLYVSIAKKMGNKISVFYSDSTCINSGAVYVYSPHHLASILKKYNNILSQSGWSSSPEEFIQRIASEWLDEDNPVTVVIRRSFGE